MEQGRKFLKVAALSNIIYGLLLFNTTMFSIGLLVLGFILFSLTFEDDILENKVFLIVTAIGSMLFNVIGGVFTFMSLNELEKERAYKNTQDSGGVDKKEEVDPESKKIDLLLKLGVGMVFVSGILFATTSWELITDIVKLITLLVLGTAFLGLSLFTEKKLNIKKTSIMYWFLSMSFYFAIIVGICYFGLLGDALSYHGEYKEIMYGVTIYTLTIITGISYLKYNHTSLIYLSYLFIFTGTYYILLGFNLPKEVIYLLFACISLIINILNNKKTSLSIFNTILSYYFAFEVLYLFETDFSSIVSLLILVNIVNITYLSKKADNSVLNTFTTIGDYVLIYAGVLINNFQIPTIIIMLLTTIITVLIKYDILYKDKETKQINTVLYAASTLFMLLSSTTLSAAETLFIPTCYLLYLMVNKLLNKADELDKYFLPITIFAEVLSAGYFINEIFKPFEIGYNYLLLVITLIYTIMYLYAKNEEKMIYIVGTLITMVFTSLLNLSEKDTFVQLMTILPLTCLFINNKDNTTQNINVILYIAILIDISISILALNLTGIEILNSLIVLVIYGLLLYTFYKNPKFTKINNFAIVVPLLYAVNSVDCDYIYKRILINILEFYIFYLLLKYLCNSKSDRDMLSIFGVIFILSQVFFNNEWIVGIYVGIVGILLIFTGFYLKEYDKLFIIGILVTIANIVYQLRQLWSQIPFYLYLLIGGLAIITFVTYKELKNSKKK